MKQSKQIVCKKVIVRRLEINRRIKLTKKCNSINFMINGPLRTNGYARDPALVAGCEENRGLGGLRKKILHKG